MPPLEGHNDPSVDVANVENVVRTANDPIVLSGTFNFGGGWDGWRGGPLPRKTVVIKKPVRIEAGRGGATILGGGAMLDAGSPLGKAHSGPFMVMLDPNTQGDSPVVFERIEFSGWKGEAILAVACRGLEVRDCRFTNPAPGNAESLMVGSSPLRFVHAILVIGPGCTGDFIAQGNKCNLKQYPTDPLYVVHPKKPAGSNEPVPRAPTPHTEALADDEQFLACVATAFSNISITHNQIWGHDAGLEVIANDRGKQQHLEIAINRIWLEQTVGERWPGHYGLMCCQNKDAVINGNNIEQLKGPGAAFLVSGENFTVTANEVHFEPPSNPADLNKYPTAGFLLGMNSPMPFPSFPVHDFGPSLNGSAISNNTLHGTAKFGIKTFDFYYDVNPLWRPVPPPNDSNGNTIGPNDLSDFNPIYASLFLGSGTHDNNYSGSLPGPEGRPGVIDEGVNNHAALTPRPAPPQSRRVRGAGR